MEHKMVTIPFDLETAKKIRKGERVGECGSNRPHDILGIKYDSFGTILKNFG